ncbi:hypothetical protein I0C86_20785 [Plantactinospora sp. S1510]|uniref:Uncharacterized protein n=1 Tax=Plantactinospora alkalitolerans TaxID=2789879 RepID=A0ABS0GZM2_9ACTN|nr:hypothetical protein [Plantactinospora alkalitolerans]MBF9131379.1 hypothetical protein [Plantactinospora alkalitolerans]
MDATGVTAVSALLIGGGVVFLALVVLAVMTDRPRTPRPDPVRLRAAAEQLEAHALATQTEAGRAAAIATQARAILVAAEQARDEAWAAQETAERDHQRALRSALAGREMAARAPTPETVPEPTPETVPEPTPETVPGPERDREVSRAALAAYRRGDISLHELREVFRRAGDWDPVQEDRERILERGGMRLTMARRAYDQAAALARRAGQEARVAEEAAQELLAEATATAAEAREAYLTAQRFTRRRPPRRGGRTR